MVATQIMDHLLNETKVPNVISYTFFIVLLAFIFGLILSRDMDEREEKLAAEADVEQEECFSEEQTKKLEEHNKGLPDVYLLVRVSYREAEKLMNSGGDVRFVSFGHTDIVIQKNMHVDTEEEVVEPPPEEGSEEPYEKGVVESYEETQSEPETYEPKVIMKRKRKSI